MLTAKTISTLVQNALNEDRCDNDITTQLTVPPHHKSTAKIVVKEKGVICGLALAQRCFKSLDPRLHFKALKKDGAHVAKGTIIARIKGHTRAILTAERSALNFLGMASGIATTTHHYVKAVKPHKTQILDTRKTMPGLRVLSKYAVTCGGGTNHRQDLSAMVMIKDNHRTLAGKDISLVDLIKQVKKRTHKPVIVEVDTYDQMRKVLPSFPNIILLDNMNLHQLRRAVNLIGIVPKKKRPLLEASGGVTLKKIKSIAETGVDRISIGALTHSAPCLDISLEIHPCV